MIFSQKLTFAIAFATLIHNGVGASKFSNNIGNATVMINGKLLLFPIIGSFITSKHFINNDKDNS